MTWTIAAASPQQTITPIPGVRYVKRWGKQIHMRDETHVPILVLQQQFAVMELDPMTNKTKCFVEWRDVPTEEESA